MAELTYVRCGKLFDGTNETLHEGWNILIEGGIIKEVGPAVACPNGAKVIDLSHLTVTPGLIDAHIHIDFDGKDDYVHSNCYDSDEMKALKMLACAQKTLQGGFTTLRAIGCNLSGYGSVDVKHAIDSGMFTASRLMVAPHCIGTSGCHGDPSSFFSSNPGLSDAHQNRYSGTLGNGADFMKGAVRREIKYGADVIKIMATGGFASPNDSPADIQLDHDEMRAIMETAHQNRKQVTAHAYTAELINELVDVGIDGIEHGSLLDEVSIEKMRQNGTYLVPTFCPYEEVVHMDEKGLNEKPPYFKKKLIEFGPTLRHSRELILEQIEKRELLIGYGTDMVSVHDNYDCWREFTAWRLNGVSALRTLVAATSANAKIIQREELGAIAPGKAADLAAWAGDLLNDPEALRECAFVMKDGCVVKE